MNKLKLLWKGIKILGSNGTRDKVSTGIGILLAIAEWFNVNGVDFGQVVNGNESEQAKLGAVLFPLAMGWVLKFDWKDLLKKKEGVKKDGV